LSSVNMKETSILGREGGHSYGAENSGSDPARHFQTTSLAACMFNVNEVLNKFVIRAVSVY